MADAAKQMNYADSNDEPALVVITKDVSGAARGSWFAASDVKVAKASAKAAGAVAGAIKGPDLMALANRVPKGRIFDSGKLFMPRIQAAVFEQLSGHAPKAANQPRLQVIASNADNQENSADKVSSSASGVGITGTLPSDWSKLGVGSLVLAREAEEESFYLAVVIGKSSPTQFSLRWRDYPDEPNFQRQVSNLAMLHPKMDLSQFDWDEE